MKFTSALLVLGLVAFAQANDGFVNLEEDTNGNYRLNYKTPTASRTEQRFHDGRVIGSYTYADLDGVHHTVNYVAAADHGFGAESADIPQAPEETPELITARRNHLNELHEAQAHGLKADAPVPAALVLPELEKLPKLPTLPSGFVPPVDADHLKARSELLAAYSMVLGRLSDEYKHRA